MVDFEPLGPLLALGGLETDLTPISMVANLSLEEQGGAWEAGWLVRTMNLRFRVQNVLFLVVYWFVCQKML